MVQSTSQSLPLVSVVIPSYNAAATLGATLDSVLAQTYPNIEIVVVDDGSRDDTPAVLSRYASRVKGVRQANGGLARARNTGLAHARGELIALLDADDLCVPDRIEMQVALLQQNPEMVLCSSDFTGFNSAGVLSSCSLASYYAVVGRTPGGLSGLIPDKRTFSWRDSSPAIDVHVGHLYGVLAMGNFIHPPTIMFRRSVLGQTAVFDPTFTNICDYEWVLRVSKLGTIGVIADSLLDYRISDSQMSGAKNAHIIAAEVLRLIDGIRATDPALYRENESRFRARERVLLMGAANVYAEQDKASAWNTFFRGLDYGVHGDTVKLALKIVMPRVVLHWLRRHRGMPAR